MTRRYTQAFSEKDIYYIFNSNVAYFNHRRRVLTKFWNYAYIVKVAPTVTENVSRRFKSSYWSSPRNSNKLTISIGSASGYIHLIT